MRPVFRKGITGNLVFRPPEGPPTSGTVTIKKYDGTEYQTDQIASGPTVDTTTSAITDAGAKTVTLTDASSAKPGQELWIGSAKNARCQRTVEEVDAAISKVYFRRPLEHGYASGVDVKSSDLYRALVAGDVDTVEANNTAWWTYIVDGETYHAEQVWDVVLRQFRLIIPENRLKRYAAAELFDSSRQTRFELLEQAEWLITQLLRWHGIEPESIFDVSELERAGGLAVRMILLEEESQLSPGRYRILVDARNCFIAEWKTLIRNQPRWTDRDLDGVVDDGEITPFIEHVIGLPDFSGGGYPDFSGGVLP